MRDHDVVEVRVHGVSGTPPQDLLDRPNVVLLDGDARAGFYRSANPDDIGDRYVSRPGASIGDFDGPYLEGYAWGGLTSGSAWRSLWLLLLPFSLLNVAPRLRPADPPGDPENGRARRLYVLWLLGRWLALCSTAVFVMAFIGVGMDLTGYQCARLSGCTAGPPWVNSIILGHTVPHQLLVGSLCPLLVLALLWAIGGRTIARYEAVGVLDTLAEPRATGPEPPGLQSRWMWQNERPVRRLRAAHLQTGVGMVVAFAGGALDGWEHVLGIVVGVGAVAFALVAVAFKSFTEPYASRGWTIASLACWLALLVTGAVEVLRLAFESDVTSVVPTTVAISRFTAGSVPPGGRRTPPGLPGYAATALWLLVAELALLLALLVVVWRAARVARRPTGFGETGPSAGMAGYGTWVLSVMAVFMGAVFTAGVYLFAGGWLHSHHTIPRPTDITTLHPYFSYPEVIVDAGAAYAVAVAFAVLVLTGCFLYAAVRLARVTDASRLIVPGAGTTDYGTDWADGNPQRRKAILRAMWLGRIVDIGGRPLVLLMVGGAVMSEAVGVLFVLEHVFGVSAATDWLHGGSGLGFFSVRNLQALGAYAVVLTLIALVVLGYYAFRKQSLRRSVGILWDLASFWPRLCHPLAAPCYAERAVPDLVERVHLHANNGYGVVVAAHSQGTVLSAAAMLQLQRHDELVPASQQVVPSTALLTCGCVLRRLYGRYFPAYFGPGTLAAVAAVLTDRESTDALPRWRNLWRYTDYLGAPVGVGPPPTAQPPWSATAAGDPASPALGGLHIDAHLIDPPFGPVPGSTDVPAPKRHSDYWKEPEFQRAVTFLGTTISVRRAP
jgi:hypothetical protein